MEGLVGGGFWRGKSVLVTGHTGFKGGWLALWLQHLGARVAGYALEANTTPALFDMARVGEGMHSVLGDVRDLDALNVAFERHRPEIVFHLAAQSLVRESYARPVETFDVNVMGTVNVMQAARASGSVRVCQVITTDKCYENREWDYGYRESDHLGGRDPYSSSKACAELAASAYARSFFTPEGGASLATLRAGNVIGGGDWAVDRIVPDCVRALQKGEPIVVRNPKALRPWQHVLEPLSAYLWLAQCQWQEPGRFAGAWNIGPEPSERSSVADLAEAIIEAWGGGSWRPARDLPAQPHEAAILALDTSKARAQLGWHSAYGVATTITETVDWYRRAGDEDPRALCVEQIDRYAAAASRQAIAWAAGAAP